MAFFKKLKERLFKSSSKIDEGLEAIVGDGGQEEALAVEVVDTAEVDAAAEQAEAARLVAEQEAARVEQEAARVEQERVAEAARVAAFKEQQEAADKVRQEAADQADQAERNAADAAQKRGTALAEQQEAERVAAVAAQQVADRARAEQEAAEQGVRDAAQKKAATPEPIKTVVPPVAQALDAAPSEPTAKPGLLGRLMGRTAPKTVVRRVLDDDMLEQLEELLIAADMGVDTALRVTANMAEGRFGKKLSVDEIKQLMSQEIARIMDPVAKPLPLYAKTPQVVLVVGVNGSGKTTTIGKLASQFKAAGKKVVIAAGDTFRAAAVEQLQVWGDRAGVPVLTAAQGSDPASLAFDAMTKAEADGADLLLIDTAGRLQNRGDLMEELAKIVRVIRKKDPSAPHNTLLVLDATTGQNALNQVKVFQEISDVSGLVMTKLDGTAKGGVLVALADKFGLPIHAIGVGEQIDDLDAFDPQEFADALVGIDR